MSSCSASLLTGMKESHTALICPVHFTLCRHIEVDPSFCYIDCIHWPDREFAEDDSVLSERW